MEYTEKDLSKWFDLNEQKPWEHGVYEVKFRSVSGGERLATSYFDGEKFNFLSHSQYDFSIDVAYKNRRCCGGGARVTRWRGLKKNPSAPKPKANKRKTMYVVVNVRKDKPCAAFDKVNDARDYAERVSFPVRVIRTRFRVPA